ncbi:MAG: TlyA family RNA methyltransferase [Clostridia bacterium]|nr:TlyA family RNA methyltransferase [Clostridia bacterium]
MPEKQKMRADMALVARGLAQSREKAQAMIMAGDVYLNEVQIRKASFPVEDLAGLTVRQPKIAFVSRGALKLQKALQVFGVDPTGLVAMDLGASTGGFTDVLLQGGAAHVYAIDVGYGQLDWKIRNDPRVTVMERTNARYLKAEDLSQHPTRAVMDVSFISITRILPAAMDILGSEGQFITLIKPQFEAGRDRVGKKGVVRDPAVHEAVIREILHFIEESTEWHCHDLTYSPIRGPEGNIEFLAYLLPGKAGGIPAEDERISLVVREAHRDLEKDQA